MNTVFMPSVGSVVGIGGMAGGLGGVLITKVAGKLFDYYNALGQIQTGYMIMFTFAHWPTCSPGAS